MTRDKHLDYLNNTEPYSIHNTHLRNVWATYNIFILLSSLIGDSIIIIASVKYQAFKLHKFIVVIIQHIAVCDLLVSLVSVFPRVVSLIANGWVFGEILKYVAAYGMYYFNAVGLLLISVMTTSKLFMLKFPLRARLLTPRRSQLVCMIMWMASSSLVLPGVMIGDAAVFDHRTYDCRLSFLANIWKWLKPILVGLFALVPNIVVIATTIYLLVIAKNFLSRRRENLKWQGIISTILVAVFYCISILPYIIYTFIAYSGADFADDPRSFFRTHYDRIMKSFMSINTISNFYIYSMTVESFREFLWTSRFNLFKSCTSRVGDLTLLQQNRSNNTPVTTTKTINSNNYLFLTNPKQAARFISEVASKICHFYRSI